MKSINNKGLVSRYVIVQLFVQQLFIENYIDTDTYVFALNMEKEELGKKNEQSKAIYAYTLK